MNIVKESKKRKKNSSNFKGVDNLSKFKKFPPFIFFLNSNVKLLSFCSHVYLSVIGEPCVVFFGTINSCFGWVLHFIVCFHDPFSVSEHKFQIDGQIKEINVTACSIEILCLNEIEDTAPRRRNLSRSRRELFNSSSSKNCLWFKFITTQVTCKLNNTKE